MLVSFPCLISALAGNCYNVGILAPSRYVRLAKMDRILYGVFFEKIPKSIGSHYNEAGLELGALRVGIDFQYYKTQPSYSTHLQRLTPLFLMSWFKAFGRRIKSLTGPSRYEVGSDEIQEPEIETAMGSFGKLLISILVFPLQILFWPMRLLGLFHQTGVPVETFDSSEKRSFGIKRLGRSIVMLPYMILTAPIRFFRGVANSGIREMMFIIPALAMVAFLGYVGVRVMGGGKTISDRYSKEAKQAMVAGDFELAKTHFSRLMQDEELTQPQKLQWVVVLAETGEKERAEEVLDELAPEDGVGFAPAHRVKALKIAFSRKNKNAPLPLKRLEQLEHHLRHSRETTPMIQQAWAIYHRSNDSPDKAIQALAVAAEKDPTYYIAIAKYQGELNHPEDQKETLRKAEQVFDQLLEEDPTDSRSRCLLADSMSQQGRFDEAQEVLVKGMKVNADESMRLANAAFFTMRHDLEQAGQNRVGKRVTYLFRALGAQPNHLPIYERLIKLADEKNSGDGSFVRVRRELNRLIAGDDPNPLAHFALSNILWQHEKFDEATIHLELAYKIEPRFTIVLNNLAWVLAHQDPPDLERALELASQAVEQSPEDGRYRDTLGTIYLKQENYTDAAAEFQLALSGVEDPIAVRKKLITVYTKLNLPEQVEVQENMIEASN